MNNKIQLEDPAAYGPAETIKEQNGFWYWADEVWQWHGPLLSREVAQQEQSLYAAELMGE